MLTDGGEIICDIVPAMWNATTSNTGGFFSLRASSGLIVCRESQCDGASAGSLRGGGVAEDAHPPLENSLPVSAHLIGERFIPLKNFQPGSTNYQNTCFIAVVVNLRALIPQIGRVLQLQNQTWKETIDLVRRKWNAKYSYNPIHRGQHDAAELLGDILWDAQDYRFDVKRMTVALNCQHEWSRTQPLLMLVVELPTVQSDLETRVDELVSAYTAPFQVDLIECDICGPFKQKGFVKTAFVGAAPSTIVIRINRYGTDGRRADRVLPDPQLLLWDRQYCLQAVLLHLPSDTNSGHYIVFIRTPAGWEKRDDGDCVLVGNEDVPPCNNSNVYVVIYKNESEVDAAEFARAAALAEEARVAAEEEAARAEVSDSSSKDDHDEFERLFYKSRLEDLCEEYLDSEAASGAEEFERL